MHAVVTASFCGDWTQDGSATVDLPHSGRVWVVSGATASCVNARKDEGADTREVDPRHAENQGRLPGDK